MAGKGLFEDWPESTAVEGRKSAGGVRLREPMRDQIELRAVDLDGVIGVDNPARIMWAYVEKLDLSALETAVKVREGSPGQAAASPRLLLEFDCWTARGPRRHNSYNKNSKLGGKGREMSVRSVLALERVSLEAS